MYVCICMYVYKYGLQEAQKKLKIKQRPLLQDVATRWGSTRASTASFLDHKDDIKDNVQVAGVGGSAVFGEDYLAGFENAKAINEAIKKYKFKKQKEKLKDYLLTEQDMKRIKNLNNFLTNFDIYSTTLGGQTFVTSSIVMPVIKSLQKHLVQCDDDPKYIAEMKTIILEDFKARVGKYINNEFLLKATALDPRFKKLKLVEDKEGREKVFSLLLSEARRNLDRSNNNDPEAEGEEQLQPEKKRKIGLDFAESDSEGEEDNDALQREWHNYRATPVVSRDEEDILGWWRSNQRMYPNIARLAR